MSFLLLNRRKPPGAPQFSPKDIPNLALWLDASDTDTIHATAGLVNSWDDKSGLGNGATSSGTLRPTTGTRNVNGRNVLDFNAGGSADQLVLPSGLYGISNASNTVIMAFASDNAGDATQNLLLGATPGFAVRYTMQFDTTNLLVQNRSTSSATTSQAMTRNTDVRIVAMRRVGTTITPYVDGVAGTPGTNAENVTLGSLYIGSNSTGTANRFDGPLCEALMYSADPSDTDLGKAFAYLANKWGGVASFSPSLDFSDSRNSMYLL